MKLVLAFSFYVSFAWHCWRANELVSTIPTHAVFIFLNPLMVDLLQVEYQNKGTTPFETHAPNMWIFFVATCAHCLGLAFEMKLQRSGALWCRVLSNLVLFFGALSSVSLASVFLPRALGWVCLTLFSFTAGFPLLLSASKCLSHRINVDFMNRFTAHKPCLPK